MFEQRLTIAHRASGFSREQRQGTADEGRLLEMVEALRNRSPLDALAVVDEAMRGGADPGQLAEQLLNYLRDVMTAGIGGGPELLKLANPAGHARLTGIAKDWGIQTILAAIQILDESLVRMRSSVSSTTLLEVALVQICQLQDLALIPAMIEAITRGGPMPTSTQQRPPAPRVEATAPKPPADEKKNAEPQSLTTIPAVAKSGPATEHEATEQPLAGVSPTALPTVAVAMPQPPKTTPHSVVPQNIVQLATATLIPVTASSAALEDWKRAMASIDGMLADFGGLAQSVEPLGSEQWTIYFPPGSQKPKEYCEVADRKSALQQAVERTMGRAIRLNFIVPSGPPPIVADSVPQSNLRAQKMREVSEHPMVKKVCELLDGEIVRVDAAAIGLAAPASVARAAKPVEHAT